MKWSSNCIAPPWHAAYSRSYKAFNFVKALCSKKNEESRSSPHVETTLGLELDPYRELDIARCIADGQSRDLTAAG